jgi:hypothetical protein
MEDKNRKVLVKNRSTAEVIITIPNRNIRKTIYPGQTLDSLTFGDLEEFAGLPGGDTLLREYLQLSEVEVKNLDLGNPEPEYNMSEKDIYELITKGSLDAFLDCLDFAPTGVIDIIKKLAVDLPISDMNKMEAIKEKTGFDVALAIQHKKEEQAESAAGDSTAPKRRVTEGSDAPKRQRRVIK